MAEQFTPPLGKLVPAGENRRDAIHVAVAPVTAGVYLEAGWHVGLKAGSNDVAILCDTPIGIVDPFLKSAVQPGERFWLCLFPGTITGLRHIWSHPAFKAQTLTLLHSKEPFRPTEELE